MILILVPMFGEKILTYIVSARVLNQFRILYHLLRWPTSIFLIYMILKLVYTITPGKKISSSSTTNGAIFTTVLWTIATAIFSSYLKYFV